jgi:hypothetical protein
MSETKRTTTEKIFGEEKTTKWIFKKRYTLWKVTPPMHIMVLVTTENFDTEDEAFHHAADKNLTGVLIIPEVTRDIDWD